MQIYQQVPIFCQYFMNYVSYKYAMLFEANCYRVFCLFVSKKSIQKFHIKIEVFIFTYDPENITAVLAFFL